MPTNVYKQRCLTCGHPVNPAAKNIGVIKMSNQPRYYHLDSEGCQAAESKIFDLYADSGKRSYVYDDLWLDTEIHQRQKTERTEMAVVE